MRRLFLFVYAVTALSHVPFALGLGHALGLAGVPAAPAVGAAIAALMVAALRGRIELIRWDRPIHRARMLLVEEPYFAHWSAALFSTVLFVVGAPVAGVLGGEALVPALGRTALAAYAVAMCVAAWAVFVRRRWVRVRTLDVEVPGLPRAFDGYRIAQLSDLHIGSLCPRERAERWVRVTNALRPDLVALTGDYVTSGTRFHQDIARAIAGLDARDGVLAVMGNHDYFGDGQPLITLLCDGGVRLLRNERITVARDGATLELCGVDDTWTRRADLDEAFRGFSGASPLVVLAHDPELFPDLSRRGASLILAGHTHWGQVAVPFLATKVNLSRISARYTAGLYRENGATLYVHPGLGTTGPPVRLGAPPEVTILRLRAIPPGSGDRASAQA